jgi:hypothetical protein
LDVRELLIIVIIHQMLWQDGLLVRFYHLLYGMDQKIRFLDGLRMEFQVNTDTQNCRNFEPESELNCLALSSNARVSIKVILLLFIIFASKGEFLNLQQNFAFSTLLIDSRRTDRSNWLIGNIPMKFGTARMAGAMVSSSRNTYTDSAPV